MNVEGYIDSIGPIDVVGKCCCCTELAACNANTGAFACENGCPPPWVVQERFSVERVALADMGHGASLKLMSASILGMFHMIPSAYADSSTDHRSANV